MIGTTRGFCVVGADWKEKDVIAHNCKDGSHRHIGWAEMNQLFSEGFLEPFTQGIAQHDDEDEKSDHILCWLAPKLVGNKVIQFKRIIPIRGLSCKIGATHAAAVTDKMNWALAMLAQIQMRREPRLNDFSKV